MAFTSTLSAHDCEFEHVEVDSLVQSLQAIPSTRVLVSGQFHQSIAAAFLGALFVLLEGNSLKNTALAKIFSQDPPLKYNQENLAQSLGNATELQCGKACINADILNDLKQRAKLSFAHL